MKKVAKKHPSTLWNRLAQLSFTLLVVFSILVCQGCSTKAIVGGASTVLSGVMVLCVSIGTLLCETFWFLSYPLHLLL